MCGLLAACGQAVIRDPTQDTPSPVAHLKAGRRPGHIAVLVMENSGYGSVIGPADTSYITGLAHRYALATQYYAISHPSLPNYLALTGGSTFGITSDCTSCTVPTTGLAGQLLAHHISWRVYAEDYPHRCFQGGYAGGYAKKHNPLPYYRQTAHRVACHYVLPFTALHAAIASRRLPRFAWITPNLCHDMHSCSKHVGSLFLQSLVPGLLRALGPRGLLFIVWDEGTTNDGCCRVARGGHVALIVAGGGARAHAQMNTPVDHFSVLQTVEDLLRLPRLLRAGCACTPSLQPLLAKGG
jgi:hypothetical protein